VLDTTKHHASIEKVSEWSGRPFSPRWHSNGSGMPSSCPKWSGGLLTQEKPSGANTVSEWILAKGRATARCVSNRSQKALIFSVPQGVLSRLPHVNLGVKGSRYQLSCLYIGAKLSGWLSVSHLAHLQLCYKKKLKVELELSTHSRINLN
jgi:hypothetical protein